MSEPFQLPRRYQPIRRLGEGAFGVVLRCRDAELRREVAIKVLKEEVCDESTIKRFQVEAEASAKVRHPNVVAVYDAGVTEAGRPYMVSEYVEGRALEDLLKAEGPVSPERGRRWVEGLLDALETVHEAGMLHRDVKPANVMVRDDQALLCDFGLSRFVDTRTRLTATGLVVGTPVYFSPELMRSEDSTPASDLFALGALGYEAVYGERWWRARNLPELVELGAAYFEIPAERFGKEPELDQLLQRLLDPSPEVRCGRPAPEETTGGGLLASGVAASGEASLVASGSTSEPSATEASAPAGRGLGASAIVGFAVILGLGVGILSPRGGGASDTAVAASPSGEPQVAWPAAVVSEEEPEALASARRRLAAGAPHPGPADALLGDQVRTAYDGLVDARTPLTLRRLVTTLTEHATAAPAALAPALDTLDRATDRFRVARAIAVQATLGGLQPTLDSVGDAEFSAEEGDALRRSNKDLEEEALRLLDGLPAVTRGNGPATPGEDLQLAIRLYLYRVRLDHASSEPTTRRVATRLAGAPKDWSQRLASGLWSLLSLDEKERVLSSDTLAAIVSTLRRDLPSGSSSAGPRVAADALALSAIAVRRLGTAATPESYQALNDLGRHLVDFRDEAPGDVWKGIERAALRLTEVGPLRAAPSPELLAAREQLEALLESR